MGAVGPAVRFGKVEFKVKVRAQNASSRGVSM